MTTVSASEGLPLPLSRPVYPVRLEIDRPERQSRLTNFPLGIGQLIRYVLFIPHLVILYYLGILAALLSFYATFAILFSGRYPRGMYDLVVGYMRWNANVTGYLYSVYDRYPPFSTEQQGYPATLTIDYPEGQSRLLNFPLLELLLRPLLLVPHAIVLFFLVVAVFIVIFIARFAILFTGAFPAGMHRFVVGVTRWSVRVQAYQFNLTDRYPPFSLS